MVDSKGHKWNVHQPSLDAVRSVISHIIDSIFARKDLSQDQKMQMIQHLKGLNHADMSQAVQKITQVNP